MAKSKISFTEIEKGAVYHVPEYYVEDGVGIVETGNMQEISFVRGSKDKDDAVRRLEGTLHDHIIDVLHYDLTIKNEIVPSEETEDIICLLAQIQGLLKLRAEKRAQAGTLGTYKK